MEQAKTFADCYVRLTDTRLTLGNDALERSWSLEGPQPVAVSLQDKSTGREWLTTALGAEWLEAPPACPAFFLAGATEGPVRVLGMEAAPDEDAGAGAPCLLVTVRLGFDRVDVWWQHRIYPGLACLRSTVCFKARGALPAAPERPAEWPQDYQEGCILNAEHLRWRCVQFADQTDDRDNLVTRRDGIISRRETTPLTGNLLFVRDSLTGGGLTFIKEGPTPQGRLPGVPEADFLLKGRQVCTLGFGFAAGQLAEDELTGYGSAILLWNGGEEQALQSLHRYHRAVRVFRPERDARIMANTWGDGNADGRISEEFLLAELREAASLGITCYQIDDGWQTGTTANSVNAASQEGGTWGEGYYKTDPNFWTVNRQRLPRGLAPITEYARAHGITLGRWFSPDSLNDFENWQRDSDTLLDLHRRYGITAFKMDGLIFRNKRGEENFVRLMRRVVEKSHGQVYFNLDTTAGVRNGYFGRVQYGTLFVENRFTNAFGRWPNYWPYRTLRNLWTLCRYLPADRLQTEFLNTARTAVLYGGDPLAPTACGQAYAAAIALCGSPLAWMELSALPKDAAATLRQLIAAYTPVQADWLAGQVLPIGQEPDGVSWTGFQSVGEAGGFLMLIREHSNVGVFAYRLWGGVAGPLRLTTVLGENQPDTVCPDDAGLYHFALPHPHSFALVRYQPNP